MEYCCQPDPENTVHRCCFCGRLFDTKSSCDNHIIYGNCSASVIEYKCQECDLLFGTDKLFKIHQRATETYYKCDLCDRYFSRQSWSNLTLNSIQLKTSRKCNKPAGINRDESFYQLAARIEGQSKRLRRNNCKLNIIYI